MNDQNVLAEQLRVASIFDSIDGEVNHFGAGRFSVFIRLAGCNLRCYYCDTQWVQNPKHGKFMTIADILEELDKYPKIRKVTITGGEPLLQKAELGYLCRILKGRQYNISIETNGSRNIDGLESHVDSFIVDYKCPSSGYEDEMNKDLFSKSSKLCNRDFIKFVMQDRKDWEKMKEIAEILPVPNIALSPCFGKLEPAELVGWCKKEEFTDKRIIINVQLHKYIWPNAKEEV